MRGLQRVPFGAFWVAALLSSMAEAAQSLALAWYLSDLRLPVTVLAALQGSDLLGTLTGVATGAWSVRRFGQRRTLVGALLLEGVVCVVVAIAAFAPGKDVSVGQAYVVAVIAGLCPSPQRSVRQRGQRLYLAGPEQRVTLVNYCSTACSIKWEVFLDHSSAG